MTTKQQHTKRDVVEEFVEEALRKMDEKGMSYADLAARTDLSRQYIYKIFNGGQNLSMGVAQKIADQLGLRITVADSI